MPKAALKEKVEQPWFGSFTPWDPANPPIRLGEEPAPLDLPLPETVASFPQTGPGGGRSGDGFLYEQILALTGGGSFQTTITTPATGDTLIYNSSNGTFENQPASATPFLPLVGGTITGTPGTLTINAPAAFTGNILTAQVDGSRRFLVDADGDAIFELTDTSNTGPTATVRISHRTSSGTPTVGMGSSLQFWGEDDAHTNIEFATIRTEASATGAGAVSSDLVMMTKVGGTSTETLRFKGSDGRALYSVPVQAPSAHIGDVTTHPATLHVSRAGAVSNPSVYPYLRVKPVNDLAISTGITPTLVDFALSSTQQLATGARAMVRGVQVEGTTWSAVAASVIDEAVGCFFNSLPVAGTNATLTQRYAAYFNGPVKFVSATTGGTDVCFVLPTDNTTLTGGITGRIPIQIGGALRYIPYYTS